MSEMETVELAALSPLVAHNKELLDYWLTLRGDRRGPPPRADFNPMAVPRLLPNIMLVERTDDGVLNVRLMGTTLADRFEADLSGRPLLAALPDGLRESAELAYREVLEGPCVLIAWRRLERASGKLPVVENLHLPWTDADGDVRFAITSIWGVEGRIAPEREDRVEDWNVEAERHRAFV